MYACFYKSVSSPPQLALAVVHGAAYARLIACIRAGVEAGRGRRGEAPYGGLLDAEGTAGGSGRSRSHGETSRYGNGCGEMGGGEKEGEERKV